jgi:CO/xanthine dehydrogenase Mo-binding subunit
LSPQLSPVSRRDAKAACARVERRGKSRGLKSKILQPTKSAKNHEVIQKSTSKTLGYGELAADASTMGVPSNVRLVQQSNLDDYQVLKISDAPSETHVYIVPRGHDMHRGGVGEPGVPPVAPALMNAIFTASGKRIRSLPLGQQLASKA